MKKYIRVIRKMVHGNGSPTIEIGNIEEIIREGAGYFNLASHPMTGWSSSRIGTDVEIMPEGWTPENNTIVQEPLLMF